MISSRWKATLSTEIIADLFLPWLMFFFWFRLDVLSWNCYIPSCFGVECGDTTEPDLDNCPHKWSLHSLYNNGMIALHKFQLS